MILLPGEALCGPGHRMRGRHGPRVAQRTLSSRWGGRDATPRRVRPGVGRGTARAGATASKLLG
jgi:hypothetical protein